MLQIEIFKRSIATFYEDRYLRIVDMFAMNEVEECCLDNSINDEDKLRFLYRECRELIQDAISTANYMRHFIKYNFDDSKIDIESKYFSDRRQIETFTSIEFDFFCSELNHFQLIVDSWIARIEKSSNTKYFNDVPEQIISAKKKKAPKQPKITQKQSALLYRFFNNHLFDCSQVEWLNGIECITGLAPNERIFSELGNNVNITDLQFLLDKISLVKLEIEKSIKTKRNSPPELK